MCCWAFIISKFEFGTPPRDLWASRRGFFLRHGNTISSCGDIHSLDIDVVGLVSCHQLGCMCLWAFSVSKFEFGTPSREWVIFSYTFFHVHVCQKHDSKKGICTFQGVTHRQNNSRIQQNLETREKLRKMDLYSLSGSNHSGWSGREQRHRSDFEFDYSLSLCINTCVFGLLSNPIIHIYSVRIDRYIYIYT